ncbi:pyruvate formate lyase family protein, partial [Acinetobacter baumannii]
MASNVGSPLISNDDQIIPSMIQFGYEKADACNYITSACWEPVAGESYEQNNILSLNYLDPFNYISDNED